MPHTCKEREHYKGVDVYFFTLEGNCPGNLQLWVDCIHQIWTAVTPFIQESIEKSSSRAGDIIIIRSHDFEKS